MSDDYVWLNGVGYVFLNLNKHSFVYKRILFIPDEYGYILTESNWNKINSIVKGML